MADTLKGQDIARASMEMISRLVDLSACDQAERAVIMRCVHAVGDVSVAPELAFSAGAARTGIDLLRRGAGVFADVNMLAAGIASGLRRKVGASLWVGINHPEAAGMAQRQRWTRAEAGLWLYRQRLQGAVVAIGNAPTALRRLLAMYQAGEVVPGLVIGMPVGFVDAAESKQALMESGLPFITCRGTRGGSPMAAAALNALWQEASRAGSGEREE
ncbi:MAG: precorrin-8X methylmutase [Syntrophomonadaceae bacterium]|jgi:precorrin-8X/cobalt-precorrin-8 methylmutase|nr:precorrin-8X methylmutase [Syntrophomonadaceae bacterium]MDH7497206.1 precorrin-8X methylmutase [Syntrophomonadaceae bacterium]